MLIFVQGQARPKFYPQEYLEVFRGLEFEPDTACPAILSRRSLWRRRKLLATAEDWAKGGVFQRSLISEVISSEERP